MRTDERDASLTGGQQQVRRCLGRHNVAHRDVIDGAAEDALSQKHHRQVDVEMLSVRLPHTERAEDESVGELHARARQHCYLAVAVGAGLFDQHHEAMFLSLCDDGIGELSEVAEAQFRKHQPDDSAPSGA